MPEAGIGGVYAAGHGVGREYGLHRFLSQGDRWNGSLLVAVDQLSALAWHPSLPIIYGVSGIGVEGTVHAWDVSGRTALPLAERSSGGMDPCHLAVSPDSRVLVVANYLSGTLAAWRLFADGSLIGEAEILELAGESVDPDRQDAAHPHQAVFSGELLQVIDLGTDGVRTFAVSKGSGAGVLTPVRETPMPPGTGPRHGVLLPGDGMAVSGELRSTVLVGHPDGRANAWSVQRSTGRTGLPRNYPGDIQRSVDGRFLYLANRGYDTIAAFSIVAGAPQLIAERDSGVAWPQHLLVTGHDLLIAGRDSSLVAAVPLVDGLPGEPRPLFECPGAGWLLPTRPGAAEATMRN